MIAIDTNILVRYFVADDEAGFKRASTLIETVLSVEAPGFVTSVSLCEIIWVLRNRYKFGYQAQTTVIELMLAAGQLEIEHDDCVSAALDSNHPDIADAIIHFIAADKGCAKTLTFDKKFARLPGVELLK